MVFARDFQDCRESLRISVNPIPYLLGDLTRVSAEIQLFSYASLRSKAYMLIDEQYSNIVPLLREVVKGLLNSRDLGFGIDN